MEINKNLSLKKCWKMVNAIQNGRTPREILDRCRTAEAWLEANEVIEISDYDELMETVAYLSREAYRGIA